jgi:general secretion pathway protein K
MTSRPQHRTRRRGLPREQRGAALLTAMIIVTLIATLASSMVWQQWRAVQVETAERARSQSAWLLSGALEWARLILKEDARNGGATRLGEPWATELKEARLSTFLAADKDNTDDAPEAFLSGGITDAQGRFNLMNLVAGGKVDPTQLAALVRLCEATGAPNDVASRIASGLASAAATLVFAPVEAASAPAAPASAASAVAIAKVLDPEAPLLPVSVDQLAFLGIDPATVRILAPYVVLLPRATTVNVNTASREVLVAAIKGLDLATAERLIQLRQRTPFKAIADVEREVPALAPLDPTKVGIHSDFFEVRGRIRLGERALEQRSLVERRGLVVVVLRRERSSSREQSSS